MALVVSLRGVNVGGHKTFRPTDLARRLRHVDTVSIGAAGTFVVRQAVAVGTLRAEIARALPFGAGIAICRSQALTRLVSRDPFAGQPIRPDVVRFVSVPCRRSREAPAWPVTFPRSGAWLVRVLGQDGPFIFGTYRREMRAIAQLAALERLLGVPVTTRNWNTIAAIAAVLQGSTRQAR